MSLNFQVNLDYDQATSITREYLLDFLSDSNIDVADPKIVDACHLIIAYMSVPGEYEGGKYDS